MGKGQHFAIPADHPALAGHFPGLPVVPGCVILDQVIAAWGGACLAVPSAKFHTPLGPDQRVEVGFTRSQNAGIICFTCRRGAELICSGQLRVTPPP
jgi:3-hydroxymyristoyl/3-hydroxydecanoyl-(acyl carrier protein) dehydratase